MFLRHQTRPVNVGGLIIGGNNEVAIQSMCTTKTADVEATVAEILRLEEAGRQLVRVTVNNEEASCRNQGDQETDSYPTRSGYSFQL